MLIKVISGYKFIKLENLSAFKSELETYARALALKGTILLSPEGMNVNLAGNVNNIVTFKRFLANDARFTDLRYHEADTDVYPFQRLKINIKKEIITLRLPAVHAEQQRAPSIAPETLKQWLDDEKDITLLDTRNDYEIRFGTFKNAYNPHIDYFSDFPAVSNHLDPNKTIVMFCTGGIRCEKAALQLVHHGFKSVYQLDGGILGYFKAVGGAHYDGECFVFDERIAVDPQLTATGTQQCRACQGPVKIDYQHHCDHL